MDMLKYFFGVIALVGCASAFGSYPGGYAGGMDMGGPSKPYSFGYNAKNDEGSTHFHKESGDGHSVSGSYGYTDHKGLHRVVDYVANAGGFHASVKTNEPGTDGKENPASVNMIANPINGGQGGNFGGYGAGYGYGGPGAGGVYGGSGGAKSIMYQW